MTIPSTNKPNGSAAFYGLQLELTNGQKWFFPWSHLINLQCENAGKLSILLSSREVVLTYLRYCDDLIVISISPELCVAAVDACLAALKDLKLPVPEPAPAGDHGVRHWDNKSIEVYRWCRPQ